MDNLFSSGRGLLRGLFYLPPPVNLDTPPVSVPEGKKGVKIG